MCMCAYVVLEGFLSHSHPWKYTPELWQGHLWAFQSLLSTSSNWSHALLVPNMGWRTGGRWLAHCVRNEVPLLVVLHSLYTHPHTYTPPPLACPPTISPSPPLLSSLLCSLISGCANPPAKSGTQLPIWPSIIPAGKREGWRGGWQKEQNRERRINGVRY